MYKIFLVISLSLFMLSCVPITTNSQAFKNVQSGLLETNKVMNDIALKVDLIAEKSGMEMPKVSDQTAELVKQIKADNEKQYKLISEEFKGILAQIVPKLAVVAGQAIGIPAPVTSGLIGIADALLMGGTGAGALGTVATLWARRKDKKTFTEELAGWVKYDKENEKKNKIKIRANALTSPIATVEYQSNLAIAEEQLTKEGVL